MKKIIYSIVAALVTSVILAMIFPKWFLREDAQWTYLNDMARVDIYLVGNVKNGRVRVEGSDPRIIKPKFFSNDRIRGAVVEIPVSYRTTSYQIQLTPQADDWGNDAALFVKLFGRDYQCNGKRRPAWVTYRNVTLNGKPVAEEKVVWHDQPFVLKYPPHASRLTLTFDIHKPFKPSDFAYINILVVFIASLTLSFFSVQLTRVVSSFNEKDIAKVLSDGYAHIDPIYRRSYGIIFGVLCFAFGFHTICFMWGNHDWSLLESEQQWLVYSANGRYMQNSVKTLLANGVYLPLIYDIISFVALALNAVLLCRYWHLEKRTIYYVLCGLVLTAQPFTLGLMYFVHMTPESFIGVTCALVALLLSEKIPSAGMSFTKKVVCSFIAIVLINFALASYPVLINAIAVALVGRLLVYSFDWDGAWQQLESGMKPVMASMLNIVLGIVSYKMILAFIFPPIRFYNTETLPVRQIPERLWILFKQCFHQLYECNFPFITQWVLWVFLGFTIILILYICFTGNTKQKIIRLFLLFGSLFGTQAAMIIAKTYVIADRVELFGLVFFEVLVMVLVLTRLSKLRNISMIVSTCVVFVSVTNDLDCLRVWKLGFDAERMLWNRVLARLEIQKDFSPSRKYDIVQVGDGISMRPRFYTRQRKQFGGESATTLFFPYDPQFWGFQAYEFFYPTRFRRVGFTPHHTCKAGYEARLKRLYQAGVLQKAGVWPQANGLIVWKDIILFVTDGRELEKYKRKFDRELGKK